MNMPSLDIIIVNWNAGLQLQECLQSIIDADKSSFHLLRVVVVDNASYDNSLLKIETMNLPLTIIRNIENMGFGAACNQGANGTEADYILFLNPDTKLQADSLKFPMQFMEQKENQNIGVCSIALLDENNKVSRSCERFPSLSVLIYRLLGLDNTLSGKWRHYVGKNAVVPTGVVDHVMGAFYWMRSALFKKLHGFDERFFVYLEDLDLSLQVKKAGYLSYYINSVYAFHKGGGCSSQIKAKRLFYSLRGTIQYARKNLGNLHANILYIAIFFGFILRILRASVKLSWQEIKELMLAHRLFFGWSMTGERSARKIQSKSSAS